MQIKEIKPLDFSGIKDRTTNFENYMSAIKSEIVPNGILWAYIAHTKSFEKVKIIGVIPDSGVKVILMSREKTKDDILILQNRDLFTKLD